jgi:GDP-L-fucose synthase
MCLPRSNAPLELCRRPSGASGVGHLAALTEQGFTNLIGAASSEVDLRDRLSTHEFFQAQNPDVVIDAAARVGGILANSKYPADFLSDNLRIQVNIMDAAKDHGVHKLLFLGSSCIYPRLAEQPIKESVC